MRVSSPCIVVGLPFSARYCMAEGVRIAFEGAFADGLGPGRLPIRYMDRYFSIEDSTWKVAT